MTDEYQQAQSGSIVVGHDGSEHSVMALHQAISLAEAFTAPLVIVRSWQLDKHTPEYTQILSGAGSFPEVTDSVRAALEAECAPVVDAHPSLSVSYQVELGAPADVLTAVSAQALLLVLGSRGRGGVAGLLLGSVVDRCVQRALRPVLIARPQAQHDPNAEPTATVEQGSIVVGHDGSENSDQAVELGFRFAAALGLPLAVVRTWSIDHVPHGLLWKDGYVASFDEVSAGVREQLIEDVAPVAERYGAVTVSYVGVVGDPGETLVAESKAAALLIVASRGRGGFTSLLLGSVSSYCAHRADCGTIIVPPVQRS